MDKTSIKVYVKELLGVVGRMQKDYPKKRFTLDGCLVGDIGEILAEQIYDLDLLEGQTKTHDARSKDRMIQIKTTMKDKLTFGDVPERYLGLKVDQDGEVEEIYNGPGDIVWDAIKHRKHPKNNQYSVSLSILLGLNKKVEEKDRIKRRG